MNFAHILEEKQQDLSPKEITAKLAHFKDSKYFKVFYEKNLALTKEKVSKAVSFDVLIIQAVHHDEELDKLANTLAKRLREWYELYNPEYSHHIDDHEVFLKGITSSSKDSLLKSWDIKQTMGADLKKKDLASIMLLAELLAKVYATKKQQEKYIEDMMKEYCPNLNAIAGSVLGAKIIASAGSFKRFSLFPSSTIQMLGAEKALFRHLRMKAKPPKHGILFQHPLVQRQKIQDQGKTARMLAGKICIAVKVDYFKGDFVGKKLLQQVEDKLKEAK